MIADFPTKDHPETATPPDPRGWLDHFPAPRRSTIANWHHYAVRSGAQTPLQVLAAVRATCARRLDWGDNTDATMVLYALDDDLAGALTYAQHVLDYEALPYDARQRAKAERSFAFVKEAMRGKEVTAAQLAYLQALGYHGTAPQDRHAASALIDELKAGRGRP